jgi:hypothetical protein
MSDESEGLKPPQPAEVIDEDMLSQGDENSSDIIMSVLPASEEAKRADSPGTPASEWIAVLGRRHARDDARARTDVPDFVDDIGDESKDDKKKHENPEVCVSQDSSREEHIEVEIVDFSFNNDEPMIIVDEGAPSNDEEKSALDPCRWANEAEAEEAQKKLEQKCFEDELKKIVDVLEEVKTTGSACSLTSQKSGKSSGSRSDASLNTEEKLRATDGALDIQRKTLAEHERILREIRLENTKLAEERSKALNGT